jgi:hypothetical protein
VRAAREIFLTNFLSSGSISIIKTTIGAYIKNCSSSRLDELLQSSLAAEPPSTLPEAALKQMIPDLKLELFRLFWKVKDILIRLPVLLTLKAENFLTQSELGALCVLLLRNNAPFSTKESVARLESNVAQHFRVLCADEMELDSKISVASMESMVISNAIACMKSDAVLSVAFLLDFVSAIETLLAAELADRIVTCRYRSFVSDLLPQYCLQLGSLCVFLWQHSADKADAATLTHLSNVTWRLFCLNLLAISDSMLEKSFAHEYDDFHRAAIFPAPNFQIFCSIRTLRTQFLSPIVKFFRSNIAGLKLDASTTDQLHLLVALLNAFATEINRDPNTKPDYIFRIQRKVTLTSIFVAFNAVTYSSLLRSPKIKRTPRSLASCMHPRPTCFH